MHPVAALYRITIGRAPNMHGFVVARRTDLLTIGSKPNRADRAGMPVEVRP